ncbi:nucleotide-diphospho-sugar transferase [Mycena polygramma]|nr:nucleotide-diphospho-sugar transferase [Mycena polygramma]
MVEAGLSREPSRGNTSRGNTNRHPSTIIVPTYHERANLDPLVTATFAALPAPLLARTEILFVDDDSRDGTVEEVARLREDGGYTVELLVRPRESDEKGLSSAVLRGFERARGTRLVVMDADLQHPPSAIPALLDALGPDDAPYPIPMALGTRYGPDVLMDWRWPMYRRLISWGAHAREAAHERERSHDGVLRAAQGRVWEGAGAVAPRVQDRAGAPPRRALRLPSARSAIRLRRAHRRRVQARCRHYLQVHPPTTLAVSLWHVLLGAGVVGVVEGVGRLPYALRRRIGLGGLGGGKERPLLLLARRKGRLE